MRFTQSARRACVLLVSTIALTACEPPAKPEATLALDDDLAKASYSLGYNMSQNLARNLPTELNVEAYLAGAQDAMQAGERQVSEEEAQRTLQQLAEQAQAQAAEQAQAANQASAEFLVANGVKEGVVTLDSGLQYLVLTAAPEGAKQPAATDTVKVHYHGTLTDGTVFDSSVDRGEPISFPLNGVIPGWTEGLQLMGEGAKWRLFIPPALAYGDRATGAIPASSTLIFDVELLAVE